MGTGGDVGNDEAFSSAVGSTLRRARRDAGLTLERAAERSGGRFAATSIAGYERGERHISLARFCDLADLYGVPADRILAEILEALRPEGRRTVVIDLTRLEALDDRDRERLRDVLALAEERPPRTETAPAGSDPSPRVSR